jgi:ABC-type branched-subunit amino acid transport system permease subunit
MPAVLLNAAASAAICQFHRGRRAGHDPGQFYIQLVSYMSAGISEGSITALAALGFLLTHKATGVISFAQGAFVTLGAYIADVGQP